MIIGHLPAGYILSTLSEVRLARGQVSRNAWITAGMLGAIFPDLDLFYFYLFDGRAHHHHTYLTHYPVVWLGLVAFSSLLSYIRNTTQVRGYALLLFIFSLSGLVHMVLDTIVGDIWWLAPWISEPYSLFHVQPLHLKHWILSFIFHWSFLAELGVVAWATWLFARAQRRESAFVRSRRTQ
jgi:inner membrane protein